MKEARTQGLLTGLQQQQQSTTIVLVTHQVNIIALTGEVAASGEMIFVYQNEYARLSAVGRVRPA
jgi:ABC-type methionine transport system ATPase subunit